MNTIISSSRCRCNIKGLFPDAVDKIILPMTVPPVNSKKFNVGLFAKSLKDIKVVFMEIALVVLTNGLEKVRAVSFKFNLVIVA